MPRQTHYDGSLALSLGVNAHQLDSSSLLPRPSQETLTTGTTFNRPSGFSPADRLCSKFLDSSPLTCCLIFFPSHYLRLARSRFGKLWERVSRMLELKTGRKMLLFKNHTPLLQHRSLVVGRGGCAWNSWASVIPREVTFSFSPRGHRNTSFFRHGQRFVFIPRQLRPDYCYQGFTDSRTKDSLERNIFLIFFPRTKNVFIFQVMNERLRRTAI